jgi:hypothetical protein
MAQRASVKPASKPVHCEDCGDRDYVPPSPKALAALEAGIQSAKTRPLVYRTERFAQYADDE